MAQSTTTTSTTLPPTLGIPGTSPLGSLQTLGSIQRVVVVPPAVGSVVAPVGPSGVPTLPTEKIAFRRFGSGPDLLLIAGEHSTMTSWDPRFLLDLAAHFRVTVFDPPGVGFSPTGLTTASIRSYADAAAGLSDALGLVTPIAIGWGLGGGVALELAERHPGVLSGIVLLDSTIGTTGQTITPNAAALLGSPNVTSAVLSRLYFPDNDESGRLGWIERISEVTPDTLVTAAVNEEAAVERRAEGDRSVVGGLRRITVPALVVDGSLDAVTSPSSGKVVADAIPHGTYVTIPDGGYASFGGAGEPEVLKAVISFVNAALAPN